MPAAQVDASPQTCNQPNADACDSQQKPGVTAADLHDDHIGPGTVIWANLEYVYWWSKRGPLPVPLVVSSFGEFIGTDFTYEERPGGRLTIGAWLMFRTIWDRGRRHVDRP